ncbi:hypothetical protein J8J42_04600 [Chryseobacterium sp. cx-311]|uniref:hypothetical protein n=1 Tax=Marnyiella aurantia TaxID=2758037 RepID=UPI001AE7C366|nr:hypothetical protein [Marnyiella aurantia]MBP0612325.1 hypothetical protein [Marnyiella aurantia]
MIHWNYLLALEQDIIRVADYIELSEDNFNTYSVELLKLNLSIGSEIDVVLKLLCEAYSPQEKFSSIKDYKNCINDRMPDLIIESTSIPRYNLEFRPFNEIGIDTHDGYHSPSWWQDYNRIKHHRNSDYKKANLKNVLYSFSALLLANLYLVVKLNQLKNIKDLYKHVNGFPKLFDIGEKYKMSMLIW